MDFAYRPLVISTAKRFHRYFGGNLEDVVAEAFYLYTKQAPRYDPELGKFSTWIIFKVWQGLIDWVREQTRREIVRGGKHISLSFPVKDKDKFDLRLLLADLSDDAATIVSLVVALDKPVKDTRKGLIKHLLSKLGWTAERVIDSFREIREAL